MLVLVLVLVLHYIFLVQVAVLRRLVPWKLTHCDAAGVGELWKSRAVLRQILGTLVTRVLRVDGNSI